MESSHIPLIMELMDNIVSEDRRRKYSNNVIVKILVILLIYGISYRSAKNFFSNHPELSDPIEMSEIQDFRTLSYMMRMDWHEINACITDLIETHMDNAAMDSFIVRTCKDSTAQRRHVTGNYKDPESSWCFGTKGWEYGRKPHVSVDADSTAIMDWHVTTASASHKENAFSLMDSVRNHRYILIGAAYDSSDIYDYILENTHSLPVIDTNPRRGIVEENLTMNRRMGLKLRKNEASRYRLRWEIERDFSILEGVLNCEYIWYVRNRNYDVALGLKFVTYNLIVLINQVRHREKRKIMDIVV